MTVIREAWPEMVIDEEHRDACVEVFAYRDEVARQAWEDHGATPEYGDTMLHMIFHPDMTTFVAHETESGTADLCRNIVQAVGATGVWDSSLREVAAMLVRKLDVAMPQIDGALGFVATRAGARGYDGPQFGEEVEQLRDLLGLSKPAALPHEFYEPGYCETCTGSGEVPGGEGIRSRFTRMNMRRFATSVKDEVRAVAWLLSVNAAGNEDEAMAMLGQLPLEVTYIGKREVTAVHPDRTVTREVMPTRTPDDADLSMFEIDVRRDDAGFERMMKDVCPICRGTGGRGLPVPDLGRGLLATDVEFREDG